MSAPKPTPMADRRFLDLGIQYYVAARFSAMAGLSPVSGNLYHHAVECLLKGELAKTTPLKELKDPKLFRHNLTRAWEAFKRLFATEDLTPFDDLIKELHRFEDLRYPDDRFKPKGGMTSAIGWDRPVPQPAPPKGHKPPHYEFVVNDLDRLIEAILRVCHLNAPALLASLNEHGLRVLKTDNPAWKGWFSRPEKKG